MHDSPSPPSPASPAPAVDVPRAHRAPRVHVELSVSFTCEHNVFVGFTENLAEGGIFVATHTVLPVGSAVELELLLPAMDGPVTVGGEVRWVRAPRSVEETTPGMGIRLVDPPSVLTEGIRAYVAERDPVFFDD